VSESGINPNNRWDKATYYRTIQVSSIDSGKNQISKDEEVEHVYNVVDNNKIEKNREEFNQLCQKLKNEASIPSKIKKSEEEFEAYLQVTNKTYIFEDYLEEQTKNEFSKSFLNFLLQYNSMNFTSEEPIWA
ncbi:MAG: hypothetical protein JXQ76_11790, partial [Campylobacterales bacterium]|nr:hypothetical protein [Campylobacterales bacterium]